MSYGLAAAWRDADATLDMDEARAAREALGDAVYHGTLDVAPGERVGLGRAPGLVSLPTTQKRTARTPFHVTAASQAARTALGAFIPERAVAKLARLRRTIGAAACCFAADASAPDEVRMLTLTYRGTNADWQPSHVRAFMDHVRHWCVRKGIPCRYVWVAELQKRGVIHYHVALWVPRGTDRLPKPDEQGWWPHGMTRIEVARSAVAYLMKYLTKGNDAATGSLPHGARCHGRGGLGANWRDVMRWLSLPSFIKARAPVEDAARWKRLSGPDGGWLAPWGGDLYRAEFACEKIAGRLALRKVRDNGRPFVVDGAYSFISPQARAAALWGAQWA